MSDRKLATVRRVSGIQPIEGKDRIVLATVDGWHVIVKKDEFNVGDLCVYCEIDSVMPQRPEFEFLAKTNYRIKTIKMGGVISQGICFPLSFIPPTHNKEAGTVTFTSYQEGDDVTEALGVTQYVPTMDIERTTAEKKSEVPAWYKPLMKFKAMRKLWFLLHPKKNKTKGFPSFISKTDETRIQNAPFMLEDKSPYIVTEKVDGQSGTFALVRHKSRIPFVKDTFEYIVCSRNIRLGAKDASSYWKVSDKYHIEQGLRNMIGDRDWVAIQGECVGPGVQKNKYGLSDYNLYVFNVIFPEGRLGSLKAKNYAETRGFQFVPIIDTNFVLPDTVDEMVAYADGKSQLADTLREGVVVRSQDGQKSFKAVSNAFLLKWNE